MGRRNSQVLMQVHAQRRCSVAGVPRRMGRRGSEVPALSSLASRRRSTLTPAYPVGLKGRGARGFSNAEFHLNNIQVKAKHEMLANLVLPAFNEHTFRSRSERRTTCGCHPATALSKKDEKRLQVTNEILETEKKYLACLNTLKTVFEDPLREESILGVKEIDIIFPNELGLIRDSHTLFMKELQERIQNWKQYGIVGDIFTKLSSSYHIDVLKIYSDYVNNFPKAMAVINKYSRGSQKFRRFLQTCSSEPECEGLDLAAYLLTPIQRLPRYVLLLRQLSKCTDSSHPDNFHLENALETMKNMINILNDSIQSSCKIVSTSISRKSVKKRTLRKRTSLKELKITKDDNDNKIIQVSTPVDNNNGKSPASVVSASSPMESPNSNPSSPSATQDNKSRPSSGSEHSFLTRLRSGEKKSRPVSTGDLDRFYDSDHAKEFNAIVEEADAGKDDKASGQSKLKTAAESVKRSWQRRSKKWRRSFEGKAISTNALPELDKEGGPSIVFTRSRDKFTFDSADTSISPTISPAGTPMSGSTDALKVACNPFLEADSVSSSLNPSPAISTSEIVESGLDTMEESESVNKHNVVTINEQEELILQAFPAQGSPYARRERKQGIQERPISVGLPMKGELTENTMEDKCKSDNDILKGDSPVWVHRPRVQKRHSDGALRHHVIRRKSSSISCASGTTGTSIGSLDTSRDSLMDSGVSGGTPDNSPTNTLRKTENKNNFRHLSVEERHAFDDVIASGFKDSEKKVKSEDQLDEKTKSKKKFKDVVKYMFSKSKRRSNSSLDDSTVQKSKSKILTRAKSFTKDSKERKSSQV